MERIGHGFDVHRFGPGVPLIIGGLYIPHERGLLGHSDADVLLHAVCDALLGAAALGDIGMHFPDTDPAYKGADSKVLVQETHKLVQDAGYSIANIDATILAERPKMAAYMPEMRRSLAGLLGVDIGQVNMKATTTERLGFVGREEGIAAEAVALLK